MMETLNLIMATYLYKTNQTILVNFTFIVIPVNCANFCVWQASLI